MEIFVYNAAKPREDLGSFNHRMQQYCVDNNVIQAKASMLGPSLIISLTVMEDVELPIAQTLSVFVKSLDGVNEKLEDEFTALLDGLAEQDTPQDPSLPFQVDILTRPDLCIQGFAIFHVLTGTLTADEDDEEDGEED